MKKKIFSACFLLTILSSTSQTDPTFQWAKKLGGTLDESGKSITVDNAGNVYTTGYFGGSIDFDPGPGSSVLTSTGGFDIFISKLDAAGNFVWAKKMGGIVDDHGTSIAVDASGNVYTTGYFQVTADFDPGAASFSMTSAGQNDVFISKLDAAGNFVWAKRIGGQSSDYGFSIATDAAGNVYTAGEFVGSVDFDPGMGVHNLISSNNGADIFVSKLDANGDYIWAKQMGGTNVDYALCLILDASGNVYTSGYFQGTADFDPSAASYTMTSAGFEDFFVSKLDATGSFIWAKSIGGTGSDRANDITLDASGNIYTTGNFQNTVDFDPGAGTYNLTSTGNYDVFVSKLDAAGNFVWAKGMGGIFADIAYGVSIDATGNVYTTGYFTGTVDFDPNAGTSNLGSVSSGISDVFISKLDASGNFIWAKGMGSQGGDIGRAIVLDASGNIYTTGSFAGPTDFDPNIGVFNLVASGYSDVFVHKMNEPVNSTSINRLFTSISTSVFPNPGKTNITVKTNAVIQSISIFDSIGALIQTTTGETFAVEQLTNGIYLIHVKTEKGTSLTRFVKE